MVSRPPEQLQISLDPKPPFGEPPVPGPNLVAGRIRAVVDHHTPIPGVEVETLEARAEDLSDKSVGSAYEARVRAGLEEAPGQPHQGERKTRSRRPRGGFGPNLGDSSRNDAQEVDPSFSPLDLTDEQIEERRRIARNGAALVARALGPTVYSSISEQAAGDDALQMALVRARQEKRDRIHPRQVS